MIKSIKKAGEKFIQLLETPVDENTLPEVRGEANEVWGYLVRLKKKREKEIEKYN